jgi:hypothetical protein
MSDTLVTLTATYEQADGTPATGRVLFAPVIPAGNTDPERVITQQTVEATLDVDGALSIDLVASDDPDWATTGPVQYTVAEHLDGLPVRRYFITVEGPGPVDLASMQPQRLNGTVVATVRGLAGEDGQDGEGAVDLAAHESGTSHDSRYYTETEVDNLLTAKAATTHDHDADYVAQGDVVAIDVLTQATYDALTPVATTLYLIEES